MNANPIDHKTCGHVDHTTLDSSRHKEIHSAMLVLIQKWLSDANRRKAYGLRGADELEGCVQDMVDTLHPFEVEQ